MFWMVWWSTHDDDDDDVARVHLNYTLSVYSLYSLHGYIIISRKHTLKLKSKSSSSSCSLANNNNNNNIIIEETLQYWVDEVKLWWIGCSTSSSFDIGAKRIIWRGSGTSSSGFSWAYYSDVALAGAVSAAAAVIWLLIHHRDIISSKSLYTLTAHKIPKFHVPVDWKRCI